MLRSEAESRPTLQPGQVAPDFELKTPDGRTVSLHEMRGKVVVIDFWGTWCGPCIMALPGLQTMYDKIRGAGVEMFGVSCGERKGADPAAVMKRNGCTYGLLLEGEKVAKSYNIGLFPTLCVIGRDGKVARVVEGYNPTEGLDSLTEEIKVMAR
jgi:peroxiredoxin